MSKGVKIVIVLLLGISVLAVFAAKRNKAAVGKVDSGAAVSPQVQPSPQIGKKLPRLVDLGAGKCIPCKMMAPILEELKKEYAGRFEVEFIDVWMDAAAGDKYGIKLIPTQVFFDPNGKELFRHEGFFSKEDILGKWKALGMDFKK